MKKVRLYKTFFVWIRSWLAFAIALLLLGLVWYGCYWIVANYAGRYVCYFKWGAIVAICFGAVMLIFNEPLVVWITGCKRIREKSGCPRLWDAVHSVTTWHARPVPRIYLCPEHGMNAFAFGWGLPGFSAVAATQGAVNGLSYDELSAVMAHEVGHIINKDILVSFVMTISVMIMALTGWMILRCTPYSSGRSSSKDSGKGALALLLVLIVGAIMYFFGRLLGLILQMFVSRQREYAADAASARIMKSPYPLISALQKIADNPRIGSTEKGAALGFMCTADPEPDDMMATHPSVSNRVKALRNLES